MEKKRYTIDQTDRGYNYYCHKVAGTGGSHPYKKWMEQNKMMFE